jgi:hypothetical protein
VNYFVDNHPIIFFVLTFVAMMMVYDFVMPVINRWAKRK